jgi:hypothetical protein
MQHRHGLGGRVERQTVKGVLRAHGQQEGAGHGRTHARASARARVDEVVFEPQTGHWPRERSFVYAQRVRRQQRQYLMRMMELCGLMRICYE